jgi:hypothetical protein
MDRDEPTTQDLRLGQLRREREERDRAASSDTGPVEHAHERRADKAAYLREKLAERERAEAEADGQDGGEDRPGGGAAGGPLSG